MRELIYSLTTIAGHILVAVSFCQAFHYNNALWSENFLPRLTFKTLTADSAKRCTETVRAVNEESSNMALVCKSDMLEVFRHLPCCMQPDSLYLKASISYVCVFPASPGRELSMHATLVRSAQYPCVMYLQCMSGCVEIYSIYIYEDR